jgi:cytoskeletal protein CcmA (bactofilin family)
MRPEPARTGPTKSGFATIGPSIVIRGEVTGDEDLLIQGQVDGSVALELHSVTIGDGGRVKAGVTGRVITVEGSVEGDLTAEEQIILRGTARVKGDLIAPRVILEDGASFRGLVDMGTTPDFDLPAKTATKPAARVAPSVQPSEAKPVGSAPDKKKDGTDG